MCEFPRSSSAVGAGKTEDQLLLSFNWQSSFHWLQTGFHLTKRPKLPPSLAWNESPGAKIRPLLYFPSCQYQSKQSVDIILLNSITDFTRWRREIAEDGGRLARVWNSTARRIYCLSRSFCRWQVHHDSILSFFITMVPLPRTKANCSMWYVLLKWLAAISMTCMPPGPWGQQKRLRLTRRTLCQTF